jgi:predicted membrane-bound spermidine synthase
MPTVRRLPLYITVFLTGCAVLIFEVAAVRLLTPYFGSSLYVLSSVLSTILLALSLGYTLGGRLADRYPLPSVLFSIIACAGTLMILLLWLTIVLLPSTAMILGLSFGPLIIAFLGFFLPALLLGIDSPFVIRLLDATPHTTGTTVGNVFFWSTIGSITGSLSAGFYLIPTYGVKETIIGTAVCLTTWATLVLWHTASTAMTKIASGILLLATIMMAGLLIRHEAVASIGTLLHETDGLYSHTEVFEYDIRGQMYRFLKNDTNYSSAIIPGSYEIAFPYASYALLFEPMVPDATNYLVLGGGAYTIPRHVHHQYPDITITTVEVEPHLLPLAYQYFEYPKAPNLLNIESDARVFLQSTTTQYDVIFSDVMNSGHYIPPHVLTTEFFATLKSRLSPEGVVILNYIGSLDTDGETMTGSLLRTIATVFKSSAVYAMEDTSTKALQNILIVLRHDNKPITFGDTVITNHLFGGTTTADARRITIDPDTLTDEMIFTDNHSRAEQLTQKQFRLHGER